MSNHEDLETLRDRVGDLVAKVEALRVREARAIQERHALKMQGLGQITAGVAHEINTPLQFIGDNLHLLRDGVQGMLVMIESLRRVRDAARDGNPVPLELLLDADSAEAAADFDFQAARVTRGFERTFEGVARITSLVEAMKRFTHPRNDLAPVDINRLLETTLVVARNEYKLVADLVCDFGELPTVLGYAGDLGQVFLNLIVNAAHAIADGKRRDRGTITVRTRAEETAVLVTVADTGCGIPPEVRERVYEPFFTTKEPGRGTGQGLAIVHAIVVERHRGDVWFDTQVGVGTAMYVRLPLVPPAGGGR